MKRCALLLLVVLLPGCVKITSGCTVDGEAAPCRDEIRSATDAEDPVMVSWSQEEAQFLALSVGVDGSLLPNMPDGTPVAVWIVTVGGRHFMVIDGLILPGSRS